MSGFKTSRTGCLKTSRTLGPAWRPGLTGQAAVRCQDVEGPACRYCRYCREAPVSEVARAYGVARSWVYALLARYREEGEAAFEPRSGRPKTSPSAISDDAADLIIRLRKDLAGQGLDAGPQTIAWHLDHHHQVKVPAATASRYLARAGLVTPAPAKRPKSSYIPALRSSRAVMGRHLAAWNIRRSSSCSEKPIA